MIKNYIFDFGNVLGEFYPERLTAPCVKNEASRKIISEVVFDREYWDKLDMGTITDEQVREGIKSRLPENLHKEACSVYDNWVSNMTPFPGMDEIIEEISKSDKKLFLISNISIGFADTYKNVPWINELLSKFDGLVFSGKVGLVKPNRDIFEYLLKKFDLKAEESLFIDDNALNIEGAESAGINGYLFDGNSEKLRGFLKL